jgi:aspartate-semialdehyde dehydrogenase
MGQAALLAQQRRNRGWEGFGLDILDNVIPFIPNEEEKVEKEARKILDQPVVVSATCTRVNVMDGHTESVTVSLGGKTSPDEVRDEAHELGLPTAPAEWIKVHDDPFRPQPRLDRDNGNGLTTTVGRVREDAVLPNGVKYLLVSHNTRMGAAAGAVLVAEYLVARRHIDWSSGAI